MKARPRTSQLLTSCISLLPPQRQRIADIAQRLDGHQWLQLAAQTADNDIHGPTVEIHLVASQPTQDVVTAEDAARLAGQHQQQFIFGASQRHFLEVLASITPHVVSQ